MRHLARNMVFVVGAGLVVLGFAVLVPVSMRLAQVNQEILDFQQQIREHEMVKPLQLLLMQMLSKDEQRGLDSPVRRPLPSRELPQLPDVFSDPATAAGLTLVKLTPDVSKLPDSGYRQLPIQVTVQGQCSSFHGYLLTVCRLPFLAELQQVSIRRAGGGKVQMTVSAIIDVTS